MTKPKILTLSEEQLVAYNNRDIQAFCACYHEEVKVLDEEGEVTMNGMETFKQRYTSLFESYVTHAWITERMLLPPHIVEKERYVRKNLETGEESSGDILVRYTERDGKIALVEFLR